MAGRADNVVPARTAPSVPDPLIKGPVAVGADKHCLVSPIQPDTTKEYIFTMAETMEATEQLCTICEKNPQMGKLGKHKMKTICAVCAVAMRDEGNCPLCRGVGVLEGNPEHMLTCTGKLPRHEKSPATKKREASRDRSLREEENVLKAQERLDARRARKDMPLKNICDMTLEEVQLRLTDTWVEVLIGGKAKRINVKSVVGLDGDAVSLIESGTGGSRVIDRTKVTKIGR